jgi:hypothetical protein
LHTAKIRIIFKNTKFYSPHLSLLPNICPAIFHNKPNAIIKHHINVLI